MDLIYFLIVIVNILELNNGNELSYCLQYLKSFFIKTVIKI